MKAKLIKENIDFKRGQDSKKALDVGMTTKRLFDSTESLLKTAGFQPHALPPEKDAFFIPFNDYSIHYINRFGEKEWIFKNQNSPGTLYETDDQKDFLEYVLGYLEDRNGLKRFRLNTEIKQIEESSLKIQKALESLNQ